MKKMTPPLFFILWEFKSITKKKSLLSTYYRWEGATTSPSKSKSNFTAASFLSTTKIQSFYQRETWWRERGEKITRNRMEDREGRENFWRGRCNDWKLQKGLKIMRDKVMIDGKGGEEETGGCRGRSGGRSAKGWRKGGLGWCSVSRLL